MSEPKVSKEPPPLTPEQPDPKTIVRMFCDALDDQERWVRDGGGLGPLYGRPVTYLHATARMVNLLVERVLLLERAQPKPTGLLKAEQALKEEPVPSFREHFDLPEVVVVRTDTDVIPAAELEELGDWAWGYSLDNGWTFDAGGKTREEAIETLRASRGRNRIAVGEIAPMRRVDALEVMPDAVDMRDLFASAVGGLGMLADPDWPNFTDAAMGELVSLIEDWCTRHKPSPYYITAGPSEKIA